MSISLQTASFDNVSHNAKPSRISHNPTLAPPRGRSRFKYGENCLTLTDLDRYI